jgi:hypothetical protein
MPAVCRWFGSGCRCWMSIWRSSPGGADRSGYIPVGASPIIEASAVVISSADIAILPKCS